MANYDNPNGFRPVSPSPRVRPYLASAAITAGDVCAIVNGGAFPYDSAAHDSVLGVAMSSVSAGGQFVLIADDPDAIFIGQTSGAYAHVMGGERTGIEGATGIMEVDEDATSKRVAKIIAWAPQPGAEEIGANARVMICFVSHVFGSAPGDVDLDAITADTLSVTSDLYVDDIGELTPGSGVSIGDDTTIKGALEVDDEAVIGGQLHLEVGNGATSITLADAFTIDATSPHFLRLDPGGAGRDVNLPVHGKGLWFLLFNAADAAENLTVKDSGGAGVCVLNQTEAAVLISTGAAWVSLGLQTVVDISA